MLEANLLTLYPGRGTEIFKSPEVTLYLGTEDNDRIHSKPIHIDQSDLIDGLGGIDTVVFNGNIGDFSLMREGNEYWSIKSNLTGGTTYTNNVERLRFNDVDVAVDFNGNTGQVYRMYKAVLGREPDESGLTHWIDYMDKGGNVFGMADSFLGSEEFNSKFWGARPDSAKTLISLLYESTQHKGHDPVGTEYWLDQINSGESTLAEVVVGFSESFHHKVALVGVQNTGIIYDPHREPIVCFEEQGLPAVE